MGWVRAAASTAGGEQFDVASNSPHGDQAPPPDLPEGVEMLDVAS